MGATPEARVKKSHIVAVSVVVLVASASAAVNIRDPMNVFGNIDMQNEFKITNLAKPSNPQDAATKNYVDNNAESSGNGGLNWDGAYDVAEFKEGAEPTATVSCEQDETLVSATCSLSRLHAFDAEAQRIEPVDCDQRTTTSASISTSNTNGRAAGVEGTCVPGSSSSTNGGDGNTGGGDTGGGSVFYGDGSDGQIVDSSSKTRSGVIHATSYTLESGNTVSLDGSYLVIRATEQITIDGTIDGAGASNNGGSGESSNRGPSADGGGGGAFLPTRGGGSGRGGAGPGGDGDESTPSRVDIVRSEPTILRMIRNTDSAVAAGGGGGDKGVFSEFRTPSSGRNGAFPGGGGGGGNEELTRGGGTGNGGDGGGGGGLVALMAPKITVNGEVDVSGEAGEDGGDGSDASGPGPSGGGGGGGSGGLIVLRANQISENAPVYDVSGGSGGEGGSSSGNSGGGDGADGADGEVIKSVQ